MLSPGPGETTGSPSLRGSPGSVLKVTEPCAEAHSLATSLLPFRKRGSQMEPSGQGPGRLAAK